MVYIDFGATKWNKPPSFSIYCCRLIHLVFILTGGIIAAIAFRTLLCVLSPGWENNRAPCDPESNVIRTLGSGFFYMNTLFQWNNFNLIEYSQDNAIVIILLLGTFSACSGPFDRVFAFAGETGFLPRQLWGLPDHKEIPTKSSER